MNIRARLFDSVDSLPSTAPAPTTPPTTPPTIFPVLDMSVAEPVLEAFG